MIDEKSAELLTPEQRVEALKGEFAGIAGRDTFTDADLIEGWRIYEKIYLAQKEVAGKPPKQDAQIANLMGSIESNGGYYEGTPAQQALSQFQEGTKIDTIHRPANPESLLSKVDLPYRRENAQKFTQAMVRRAQASINKIVMGRHGN